MPGIIVHGGDGLVNISKQHYGVRVPHIFIFASRASRVLVIAEAFAAISGLMTLRRCLRGRAFFAFCTFHWFINANRRQFSQILYLR